jgi:hypothetical protein
MSMTKQIQIAIAVALLIAVSAPAFAETQRCMNKIGVCDKGEERSEPERSVTRGGDAPTDGEGQPDTDTGEPDTSEPSVE